MQLNNGVIYGFSEPIDYEALRNNQEFRYHLESYLEMNKLFQNTFNRGMESNINHLQESIVNELKD